MSTFSILGHGPEVVLQDVHAAAAQLAAVLRPDALSPVTEAARLGRQQMEQGVAVGVGVAVDALAVQDLMESGGQLVHGRQEALVALLPANVVGPRAALEVEVRLLAFDLR